MDPKEQILKIFQQKGEAMRSSEIAVLSGLDSKIVEKEMNKLKAEDLIFSPKRCFWQAK